MTSKAPASQRKIASKRGLTLYACASTLSAVNAPRNTVIHHAV